MISTRDFSVAAVQTAVFTPDGIPAPSKFIASVLKLFPDRYAGEMEALPLPEHIPAEVPRAVLQSENKAYRLEAAPARINSHWRAITDGNADILTVAKDCAAVQAALVHEHQFRVGRLALIVTRVCRIENPAQILIERFCSKQAQQEPFNRSATFEIHNHKQYTPQLADFRLTVNSWVRCKTATLLRDKSPAVLVEQDLNTLAEESEQNHFTDEQILAYFDLAAHEVESVFSKYFPG